ncbi:LamG-like jellyroll fold domain-containing protein [Kutzneria sp. NPDC051319]|uniref:LamG-like jellyroll fold domain-containing protein n=1 Tax=Kutzneria sp. NPDC051319 TaxID=3155047 RepID=UPI003431A8C9
MAAAAAPNAETLGVDLGAPTGAFHGGASGALYGIYDQGVPSDNLIAGMGLASVDTKAQDGQQHPGSDALDVAEPFFAGGGRDLFVYMTDVYRNFPYERTSYAEYQEYLRTEVQQILKDPNRDHIVLIPYNEPDGNWFSGLTTDPAVLAAFDNEWLQTYRFLKGLWPQARIAGPNFYSYHPDQLKTFLTFCKQNNCVPDVTTWHELWNTSTVRPDVAAYRQLETSLGIAHRPVNLNEYAARYQLTSPGRMVSWLSAIEDTKVDGDLPYWNQNGSLGDSVSQNNIPNAQWWLYHWYSSMTGQTVAVAPPSGDTDNTLQGVATLDKAKRQARIIVGGGPAGPANIMVKHIDPTVFGHTVHATVQEDDWSGMTGAAATPARMFDSDVQVAADGSLTVPVNVAGPSAGADCAATGPRAAGRLGSALKLCGNNEYANLPAGIVNGLHDFTVSAWVNPAQNSNWSRLFDFGSGTNDNMFLTLNDGSAIRFAITTGGGSAEQRIDGTATLPTNAWSLVTVTVAGNTGTLYVDGKAVGTNSNMTLHPADLGATTQNWIGRSQYSTDPGLNGEVDDFAIYDRALPAADVAGLAAGQAAAGDVADYRFDETGGATATDSSGHGRNATVVSSPGVPTSMNAYQITLSPGGGAASPIDDSWHASYPAAQATMTGSGWNVNTEGTPSNLGGFASYGDTDVGGLRTGSDTVITFPVTVPTSGDYALRVFDGSNAQAPGVSGPTNVFLGVDSGTPQQVWLPDGYGWVIWNHADTTVRLTAGAHRISLSTTGANGAVTHGDAIINKIDLRLATPARKSTTYEAEQADLRGARPVYQAQGQSGAGAVELGRGQTATFWVYSAADGYADLAFRSRGGGTATVAVNDQALPGNLDGGPSRWATDTNRVYLTAGINKVVVTGRSGCATLDNLIVTPVGGAADIATYQAEGGTLTGTAHVDNTFSQAHNGVVTGIGGGSANALTMTVRAPAAGTYAMTVRYANNQGILANHYNPDLMTAPADISVNGGPTVHTNFANTLDWNQFWTRTVTVRLGKGSNTIRFVADQQYNWDGTTVGVIRSGSDVGDALRSDTAPNIDQITLAPLWSASQSGGH